ncbi:MAG: acetolactate synthase small subunit [bacterium]
MSNKQRQTLSALVENKSGVLSSIAGLFSGRGFNIASLTVGETVNPDISRMTIVVEGDHRTLEQVVKQLRKLVVTIKVEDFAGRPFISSELLMVKVSAPPAKRGEIMDIIKVFNGKVVDMTSNTLVIRFTGETDLIDDVIEVLKPYGIKETARTGALALGRESR